MATYCSHRLIMGAKCRKHDMAFIFDRMCFILAGNEDRHKIVDEFDIGSGPGYDPQSVKHLSFKLQYRIRCD